MLYLILCLAMMALATFSQFSYITQAAQLANEPATKWRLPLEPLLLGVICLLFMAPVLSMLLEIDAPTAFDIPTGRTSVYLLGLGAVVCTGYASYCWQRAASAGGSVFWPTGKVVVLSCAAVVGLVSAFQHLSFFSNDKAGWADVRVLKEIGDIQDMQACVSPIALVQFEDAAPFGYRCPESVLFNSFTSEPFVPWPDYVDGESEALGNAIIQIQSDSRRESASVLNDSSQ
ncbi:hypothetical protein ACQYZY_28290 [Pseudomonas aeruginosa]|jgi:hypothetical protein|uniref:hypothetical protein n=1 Tax=Pseudomonas aeruginosa TaxID=287 RepID=UPI003D2C64D7